MTDGELILVAGALLAGALAASRLAEAIRVPGLVLFLGLGMAIGSDGTGWIDFSDYGLARAARATPGRDPVTRASIHRLIAASGRADPRFQAVGEGTTARRPR